mmetsp:Transcript_40822/g.73366  ORF Transcript_40822/g.73366 Transcript_40822/m.73366 type:complete len:293 (+) Transcript_40822:410-1288(+)
MRCVAIVSSPTASSRTSVSTPPSAAAIASSAAGPELFTRLASAPAAYVSVRPFMLACSPNPFSRITARSEGTTSARSMISRHDSSITRFIMARHVRSRPPFCPSVSTCTTLFACGATTALASTTTLISAIELTTVRETGDLGFSWSSMFSIIWMTPVGSIMEKWCRASRPHFSAAKTLIFVIGHRRHAPISLISSSFGGSGTSSDPSTGGPPTPPGDKTGSASPTDSNSISAGVGGGGLSKPGRKLGVIGVGRSPTESESSCRPCEVPAISESSVCSTPCLALLSTPPADSD